MVSSEDIQNVLSNHIQIKEYYHIIVCADRILDENFQDKNSIMDFITDFFDYSEEQIAEECAESILELLHGDGMG